MQAAGLNKWCSVEGTLFVFENKSGQEIFFQEINGLGLFMEIEQEQGQTIDDLINLAKGLSIKLGSDFQVKKVEKLMSRK
ncbi:MAG: hypothetical protein FWE16_04450 [Firmicutes bacterium]|nr:hypothetical protein [Bacillota bacterium]